MLTALDLITRPLMPKRKRVAYATGVAAPPVPSIRITPQRRLL
jgi:hypothetical protein